jgi:hypothetical protein
MVLGICVTIKKSRKSTFTNTKVYGCLYKRDKIPLSRFMANIKRLSYDSSTKIPEAGKSTMVRFVAFVLPVTTLFAVNIVVFD